MRGAGKDVKAAEEKFKNNTAWRLTKLALESRVDAAYLSTPVKVKVDLGKSGCDPLLSSSEDEKK